MRGQSDPLWRFVGLLLVAVILAEIGYLALTWDRDPGAATDPGTSQTPDQQPDDGGDEVEADAEPPEVTDQRRKDFVQGDDLPNRSRIFDSEANESGLELAADGLTHGAPVDDSGTGGYLETRLKTDVQALGFRVRFVGEASGSAVLAAWQTSWVSAMEAEEPAPASGMSLVVTASTWSLSIGDGEELAQGTFAPEEAATFEMRRDGADLFVIDPAGEVTRVTDPRAEELAGPWASWGLTEAGTEQIPAVIESAWAG